MSVPAPAARPVQNLTTNPLSLHPFLSSLNIIPTANLTSAPPAPDLGLKYVVPNTQITMYFNLGFRVDRVAMRDTINAALNYCEAQIESSGDVPLPQTEDPFHDDLGYGAAIYVVSTKPYRRLTWGILNGIIEGLWNFLVVEDRFLEAEFNVLYAGIGTVGRGTISEAATAPDVE